MNEEKAMIIDKIAESLFAIHPLVSKSMTRATRGRFNVTPGTLYVLWLLTRYDKLSMSEIGTKLSISKPNVTALVDKLIAVNMVERVWDPNDRRVINVQMTEKGKKNFKIIKDDISQEMRKRIQTLDEERIVKLLEAARYVRETLMEIMVSPTSGSVAKEEC